MDSAREALCNARAALAADCERWRSWLAARGIDPEFSHDGALQTIELMRKAKDARERSAQAQRRVEAARERAREYEEAVDRVMCALGMPPAGEGNCQAAVDRLVRSSAEAEEAVNRRKHWATQVQILRLS